MIVAGEVVVDDEVAAMLVAGPAAVLAEPASWPPVGAGHAAEALTLAGWVSSDFDDGI